MLALRAALAPEARRACDDEIARLLFASPRWRASHAVMAYCSFPDEVETRPILERALSEGKRLFLPRRIPREKRFEAVEARDLQRDLAPTSFRGLVEPLPALPSEPASSSPATSIDLIILPGIAFDREGYRLGFGAGMYDKFLAVRPAPWRLAIAYSVQIVDHLPRDPHDIPVQAILTENGWQLLTGDAT